MNHFALFETLLSIRLPRDRPGRRSRERLENQRASNAASGARRLSSVPIKYPSECYAPLSRMHMNSMAREQRRLNTKRGYE